MVARQLLAQLQDSPDETHLATDNAPEALPLFLKLVAAIVGTYPRSHLSLLCHKTALQIHTATPELPQQGLVSSEHDLKYV